MMNRCIVVGNAPLSRDRARAELIDSYDTVIRVNGYRPERAEAVGKKIDILALGCPTWRDKKPLESLPRECIIWGIFPYHSYKRLYAEGKAYGYMIDKIDTKYIAEISGLVGVNGFHTFPTSGIVTIHVALQMQMYRRGGREVIDIAGFSLDGTNWEGKQENRAVCHDLNKDGKYLKKLIKEGKVRPIG